jgi:hypothetical protein
MAMRNSQLEIKQRQAELKFIRIWLFEKCKDIPLDPGFFLSFAGSVSVSGREQLLPALT